MPEMTKYEPGTPSWVDLGTSDPADARRFYSALFGWTVVEGPPEAGGYSMCELDGKPVAGLGPQMNTDMPPFWTTYVSVAEADETAAAIKEDGGSLIVDPMDVFDFGRMAVAADPAGAVFSIWQPRKHFGAAIVNDAIHNDRSSSTEPSSGGRRTSSPTPERRTTPSSISAPEGSPA